MMPTRNPRLAMPMNLPLVNYFSFKMNIVSIIYCLPIVTPFHILFIILFMSSITPLHICYLYLPIIYLPYSLVFALYPTYESGEGSRKCVRSCWDIRIDCLYIYRLSPCTYPARTE